MIVNFETAKHETIFTTPPKSQSKKFDFCPFGSTKDFSLEEAMEYISEDEYLEVTPKSIRMRKIAFN